MKLFKKLFHWPKPFTVNLANPNHRFKLLTGFALLVIVGLGFAVGGVTLYTWSESVPFCGTTCHSMYPQMTRYQESPHRNVACVHCHVGPGAAAFVQSKIDGTRQLIGTITDNYSRPILSPVHNLRPARETCEECHTPSSFKDNITKTKVHFMDDEANTPTETTLVLKLGGVNPLTGESKGVHWHIQSKVTYIATDRQRQDIAWIGIEQADGSTKEFFSSEIAGMGGSQAFVEEAKANGELRQLDCIDCHNRTAHYIPYPEELVDSAMSNGLISRDLPFIRAKAVAVLSAKYETVEDAYTAIDAMTNELKVNAGVSATEVDQAGTALKDIFDRTNFPDMKLDYTTNPNNANHSNSLGCFRCHDGNHYTVPETGEPEVISAECNLCHTVPIVGSGDELLVQAPSVLGKAPETHKEFSWTITHQSINEEEKSQCYLCHGTGFCNNGACHNLEHPTDMAFTHATEVGNVGTRVCATCHQKITCLRCHPDGYEQLNAINQP